MIRTIVAALAIVLAVVAYALVPDAMQQRHEHDVARQSMIDAGEQALR